MKNIIIGISGASGSVFGVEILNMLRPLPDIQTHLVVSPAGYMNLAHELNLDKKSVHALADHVHSHLEIGASIASGSFKTHGMIVAPCSVKTLSAIANGYCDNLLTRAADVCLKERRKLVLMVRETPLHRGHIRNMDLATQNGAIIAPPLPLFYARPTSIEHMVQQICAKTLGLFDDVFDGSFEQILTPWNGMTKD